MTRRVPSRLAGAVLTALAMGCLPTAGAVAFELETAQMQRDGPAFVLEIEARFQATPEALLAVLTDYAQVQELHPQLLESRSLGPVGPQTEEVYTRLEGCVLLFCRTLHRVEHIRRADNSLIATDIPGRGSFSEGRTEWHFTPHEGGARLQYRTRFVPAFHVSRLFGAAALARSVERMTLETMEEVDRRAVRQGE